LAQYVGNKKQEVYHEHALVAAEDEVQAATRLGEAADVNERAPGGAPAPHASGHGGNQCREELNDYLPIAVHANRPRGNQSHKSRHREVNSKLKRLAARPWAVYVYGTSPVVSPVIRA
jgi:hypothetical protein